MARWKKYKRWGKRVAKTYDLPPNRTGVPRWIFFRLMYRLRTRSSATGLSYKYLMCLVFTLDLLTDAHQRHRSSYPMNVCLVVSVLFSGFIRFLGRAEMQWLSKTLENLRKPEPNLKERFFFAHHAQVEEIRMRGKKTAKTYDLP
ncbi:hypothetical protein DFH08DRAFT_824865 [Mycena albidolilacea]|uniref:Uncharacterized protein n=1 Tax=Mycena albidolilacea TaxID=1033008 RepID=A0AAD6Z3Y7_9AGAR|nr:hypothetical protein DFH08DRAFT_824865 [Mycena albidolilacea]